MRVDTSLFTQQFSDDYLAGFFDGEGCLSCTIRTRGVRMCPQWQSYASVHVGGCLPVLAAFERRFGGAVGNYGASRLNGHRMDTWRLQANGQTMGDFCQWVIDHCFYKKPIAEILLPVCRAQPEKRYGGHGARRIPTELILMRAAAFQKVSSLNSGKGPSRSPHYKKLMEWAT